MNLKVLNLSPEDHDRRPGVSGTGCSPLRWVTGTSTEVIDALKATKFQLTKALATISCNVILSKIKGMMNMKVVQMSQKGQILIPKKMRNRYGVKPGSKVQILEERDGLLIKAAPDDPIEAACGFIEGDFSLTEDLIQEHRKEVEREKPSDSG